MTLEKQTAAEILATVESLLKDTYAGCEQLEADKTTYNSGQINAYTMVLDAFAEAGFDINKED